MKPSYCRYTTAENDEVIGPIRIMAMDKVQAEAMHRARGWKLEEGPRLYTAVIYQAAKRAHLTDKDFDTWLADVAEYESFDDEEDTENPTQAGDQVAL